VWVSYATVAVSAAAAKGVESPVHRMKKDRMTTALRISLMAVMILSVGLAVTSAARGSPSCSGSHLSASCW
jgi:hypothetical protein